VPGDLSGEFLVGVARLDPTADDTGLPEALDVLRSEPLVSMKEEIFLGVNVFSPLGVSDRRGEDSFGNDC
jgi:hypothetical protein